MKEFHFTFLIFSVLLSNTPCNKSKTITSVQAPPPQTILVKDTINTPQQEMVCQRGVLSVRLGKVSSTPVLPTLHTLNLDGYYFHAHESQATIYSNYIQKLKPYALRFPGGTLSNYYHLSGSGYDIRAEDIEKTQGDNIRKAAEKHLNKQQEVNAKNKPTKNYLYPFTQLCKQEQVGVVLTLNLFSSKPQELKEILSYFKEQNIELKHLELGNEYFFKAYQQEFPSVKEYIAKAKEISLLCKTIFPKALIGVPIADFQTIDFESVSPHMSRLQTWNALLAKESFFDAVIVHNYSKAKACSSEANPENMYCVFKENEEHIFSDFPASMAYYEKEFGSKKVWITEWNTSKPFELTGNTLAQAIYYIEYLLEMTKYKQISLATYHNFLSGGNGYNLIKEDKNGISHNTAYTAAEWLGPIFNGSYFDIEKTTTMGWNSSEVYVRAFQGNSETIVFLVHKLSQARSFWLSNIQGVSSFKSCLVDQISGELHAGKGANHFANGPSVETQHWDNPTSIELKPWSITRIVFKH